MKFLENLLSLKFFAFFPNFRKMKSGRLIFIFAYSILRPGGPPYIAVHETEQVPIFNWDVRATLLADEKRYFFDFFSATTF